jgi:drug/metabolite transporter (DMT)-like permease
MVGGRRVPPGASAAIGLIETGRYHGRVDVRGRVAAIRSTHGIDLVGVGFILLTSLQFGSVVVLGKIATRDDGLPIASMLAVRFTISAGLLATALLVLRRPLRAASGEGWRLAALGIAGYAVEAAFFFEGLKHGTAAAATLLFFTYPVVVALLAFLLGKGLPGWLLGSALVAAVAGAAVVAIAGGGVDIDGTGVVLELASSLTFAVYLVGAAAVLKRTNSLVGAMWVAASAAVGLAAYAVATGAADAPGGWDQWGPVLAMGAFTAGAFATLFAGLRRLGPVRTAILSATEPLTAAALAAIFLGESVQPGTIVGGVLILAGAMAASVARAQEPGETQIP